MKRYTSYEEIPHAVLLDLQEKVEQSPYRQHFHVEGDMGYVNDPNGCCYYNGQYHLFHQWSPLNYAKQSWLQGWYHLVSDDLVKWERIGPAIIADTKYETHGSYSGSALVENDQILLFYTGNTRIENGGRVPYQLIATMGLEGEIIKEKEPTIIGFPKGYTAHFRDPKMWKSGSDYYAVIGAQRENLTGAVLLLHSTNGFEWEILGEVHTAYDDFGYMWECPNYIEFEEASVLIYCPQGLEAFNNQYQNIHQCGYMIGNKIDKENRLFSDKYDFQELDKGFDFYAAQVMEHEGKKIMFAWMGLPATNYPTEEFAYSGCLTMPRELILTDGKLYQKPLIAFENYAKERVNEELELSPGETFEEILSFNSRLQLTIKKSHNGKVTIDLLSDALRENYTRLTLDYKANKIILDREKSGVLISEEFGVTRQIYDELSDSVFLDIFIDRSSIEVFINDGECVASSRIFPKENQTFLFVDNEDGNSFLNIAVMDLII